MQDPWVPPPDLPPPALPWTIPGRPEVLDTADGATSGRWGMGDAVIGLVGWFVLSNVLGLLVILYGSAVGRIDLAASTDAAALSDQVTAELGSELLISTALAGLVAFVGWSAIVSRWKGTGSLRRDIGLSVRWSDAGWGLIGGIASLVLTAVIGVVYALLTGDDAPTNTDDILGEGSIGIVAGAIMLVCVGIIVPFAEEVYFRGLLLGSIRKRGGWIIALVVSSLVFGLLHSLTGAGLAEGGFVAGVTALFGVVFGLLRVLVGRLGPAIIAHMINNSLAVSVVIATQG